MQALLSAMRALPLSRPRVMPTVTTGDVADQHSMVLYLRAKGRSEGHFAGLWVSPQGSREVVASKPWPCTPTLAQLYAKDCSARLQPYSSVIHSPFTRALQLAWRRDFFKTCSRLSSRLFNHCF